MEKPQEVKEEKIFAFKLSQDECLKMMNEIQSRSKDMMDQLIKAGNQITTAAKEDDLEALKQLVGANLEFIQILRMYVQEAFESALSYRYDEIIQYFLQNGINLKNYCQDCLLILTDTARFFPDDPPLSTLNILLKFGADPNYVDKEKFRTPLHLSCKYGIYEFVQALVENGAEVNPVDGKKKTPMKYAEDIMKSNKKNARYQKILDYLKSKGGEVDWRQHLE